MPGCSQPNCTVDKTGVCLDGLKEGCPHLLPESSQPVTKVEDPKQAKENLLKSKPVVFHSGEKLKLSEASNFLRSAPARVVLCAGSQRSGKTTFLARIIEMFYDGSFKRFRFAKSITLCAFEKICWLAAIVSGVGSPDTGRTRRPENDTFFHLRTHSEDDTDSKIDLLISDLAGETFPDAISTKEFCIGLQSLGRADHLVLFMDCARLKDPALRHTEQDGAKIFLQRVIGVRQNDCKALHVQVLFSRFDYIVNSPDRQNLEMYCKKLQAEFEQRFGTEFASLKFLRIATRPTGVMTSTDSEIQDLFGYWIETPPHSPSFQRNRISNPNRDFSAYGLS